jgi:hypothetical protein
MAMRNVSARKNASGGKMPPGNGVHHSPSKTPGGATYAMGGSPAGTKPMPRVGGQTSNITPTQGVKGGPGCG